MGVDRTPARRRAHARSGQEGARLAPRHASDRTNVLGLRALLALRDVELGLLALKQLAEALGIDVRKMREHVGAAPVLLDEAEALFRVEPLHGASSHVLPLLGGACTGNRTARIPCRCDDDHFRHAGEPKMRLRQHPAGALKFMETTTATEVSVAGQGPGRSVAPGPENLWRSV